MHMSIFDSPTKHQGGIPMKRLTALLLSLLLGLSLCACGVKTGNNDDLPDFTEPPEVTLDDGTVVYSQEPFVEFPQTGEYKETALLTNVPGQGVPLLLDMRQDGTIDYIFADVETKADIRSFGESGIRYFTIAPDGIATEQGSEWMAEIDRYTATCPDITPDPKGRWRYLFAVEEGTILVLAQYHNVVQTPYGKGEASGGNIDIAGSFQHSILFKVAGGQVTTIPLQWEVKVGSKTYNLSEEYLSGLELKDGQIILSKRACIYWDLDSFCTVTYRMDGSQVKTQKLQYNSNLWGDAYTCADDTGLVIYSLDQPLESQTPE